MCYIKKLISETKNQQVTHDLTEFWKQIKFIFCIPNHIKFTRSTWRWMRLKLIPHWVLLFCKSWSLSRHNEALTCNLLVFELKKDFKTMGMPADKIAIYCYFIYYSRTNYEMEMCVPTVPHKPLHSGGGIQRAKRSATLVDCIWNFMTYVLLFIYFTAKLEIIALIYRMLKDCLLSIIIYEKQTIREHFVFKSGLSC